MPTSYDLYLHMYSWFLAQTCVTLNFHPVFDYLITKGHSWVIFPPFSDVPKTVAVRSALRMTYVLKAFEPPPAFSLERTSQGGEPIWQDLCFGANPVRFGANPVRSDRICSQNGGHRQNYSHLQMIFGCKQTKWRGYFAICHCKGWHVIQVCLGEYPWIVYSFHLIDIAEKKLKTEMIWLDLLHPIWMRKQVI